MDAGLEKGIRSPHSRRADDLPDPQALKNVERGGVASPHTQSKQSV